MNSNSLLLLFVLVSVALAWKGKAPLDAKTGPFWGGYQKHDNDGENAFSGVHDVCVIGAGASGMSAAAFLKDEGADVVVIESQSDIGGYCNTVQFAPPAPGAPAWIDIGVG